MLCATPPSLAPVSTSKLERPFTKAEVNGSKEEGRNRTSCLQKRLHLMPLAVFSISARIVAIIMIAVIASDKIKMPSAHHVKLSIFFKCYRII